jgi:hypothetical protein
MPAELGGVCRRQQLVPCWLSATVSGAPSKAPASARGRCAMCLAVIPDVVAEVLNARPPGRGGASGGSLPQGGVAVEHPEG